jgi:acyl CoA:acetate/3-ketoacid CoA transferase alpha subunit
MPGFPAVALRGNLRSCRFRVPAFLSLREAVAHFVHDGDTVALEGFTHLIPFAAGHEVIRQGRRDSQDARTRPRPGFGFQPAILRDR